MESVALNISSPRALLLNEGITQHLSKPHYVHVSGNLMQRRVGLFGIALSFFLIAVPMAGSSVTAQASHRPLLVVLGDSITWGLGASANCTKPTPIPPSDCGTTYVDDLARLLGAEPGFLYQNVGMLGATTVTIPLIEVPKIEPRATLVVLYAGSTDQLPIARGEETLENWQGDYLWALAAIRQRAPNARIVIATIPIIANTAQFMPGGPDALPQTTRWKAVMAADAMDAFIMSQPADVVDLRCDRDMYNVLLNSSSEDTFHFGDTGYARMASTFYRVIKNGSDPRPAACSPYTDAPRLDRWYEAFLSS
jgi:lysophospholipase L1-like esterase